MLLLIEEACLASCVPLRPPASSCVLMRPRSTLIWQWLIDRFYPDTLYEKMQADSQQKYQP